MEEQCTVLLITSLTFGTVKSASATTATEDVWKSVSEELLVGDTNKVESVIRPDVFIEPWECASEVELLAICTDVSTEL